MARISIIRGCTSRAGRSPAGRRSRRPTISRRRGAGISPSPGCWSPGSSLFLIVSLMEPPRPARSRARNRGVEARPHLGRHQAARAAALPDRRRGAALQHPAEAQLRRGDLRPAAADGADRPHHVAGDGRGLAVAARPVRRPSVGALDPLHLRGRDPAVHHRPSGDGRACRPVQRDPVDDHRPLPRAAAKGASHDLQAPVHRRGELGPAARRLRPAQQQPAVPQRASLGGEAEHGVAAADLAARRAGARISRSRAVAVLPLERHGDAGHARLMRSI